VNTLLKEKLYRIIFGADTRAGKSFDIGLLIVIIISVVAVMLESIPEIEREYGHTLFIIEWAITICFTIEYALRIWIVRHHWNYIFSFYGIIDLLAILPSFLGIFLAGAQGLITIRALRLLRVFRLFKLTRYTTESNSLVRALKASREKISVFLFAVIISVIFIGTLMYLVEGAEHGFTSIPKSIYWAIVTLTTVGYGDIAPVTALGQFIASLVMIMGYGIIAVPTGIVTAEITREKLRKSPSRKCRECGQQDHLMEAAYCYRCGHQL
jgi:voltage-gated potassium channel